MMPTFAAAVSSASPVYADQNYGTFDPGPSRGRTFDRTSRSSSSDSRDTFGAHRFKRSPSMEVLTSPLSTPLREQPPAQTLMVRHVRPVPGIESPLQSRWSSATDLPQTSLGDADGGCLGSCRALLRSFWRGMWTCGA